MKTLSLNLGWALLVACAVGCGDAGVPVNADGGNAGRQDGGASPGGADAGSAEEDAGTGADAGTAPTPDAGSPSLPDAGTGGGTDAGVAPDAGCDLSSCGGSPDSPGTRGVQVSSASITEPKGTVALTVFTPAGVTGAPVVVLHPGFQLPGDQYTSYAQHLASRGYVAIIADPPDGLLSGPTHAELATYLIHVLDWVDQQATSGALAGVADPSRLGLAGHSMGGKVSLLVASTDVRPKAVFALDPVDSGSPLSSDPVAYPSVTPEKMGSITVPLGILGETTNATCSGFFCQPCAPAAQNFEAYAASASSPTVVQEMVGANHVSFLDNPACGFTCSACSAGTDVPSTTRRLSRRAMTAFFDHTLRGDTGARGWLAGAQVQPDVNAGLVEVQALNGF